MPFHIQRLRGELGITSIQCEWRELHESVELRTPFGSPLWNTLWWKHYAKRSIGTSFEAFVHTVRDDSGKLRAVAPWVIIYRPSFGPFRIRILTTFGADPSLTEIRGVVCRKEDESAILAALEEYLRQLERSFDAVEWTGIRTLDALDRLEANGQLSFAQVNQIYILSLSKSWADLQVAFGKKWRKYLRRSEEKLDEIGKKMELRVLSSKNDILVYMDQFFKLHSMRANAKSMFAHPDKFQNRVNRDFIYEVVLAFAEQDAVRIFEARVGDAVAACRLSFVLGPTIYLYYSGYDPEWREYNVGSLMMIRIIHWAMQNKFKEINLSAGKDRSKTQWKPTEYTIQGGVHIKQNFRGGGVSRYYSAVNSMRLRRRNVAP